MTTVAEMMYNVTEAHRLITRPARYDGALEKIGAAAGAGLTHVCLTGDLGDDVVSMLRDNGFRCDRRAGWHVEWEPVARTGAMSSFFRRLFRGLFRPKGFPQAVIVGGRGHGSPEQEVGSTSDA